MKNDEVNCKSAKGSENERRMTAVKMAQGEIKATWGGGLYNPIRATVRLPTNGGAPRGAP